MASDDGLMSSDHFYGRGGCATKGRGASTTPLPRFHYKLYLTKLKPYPKLSHETLGYFFLIALI